MTSKNLFFKLIRQERKSKFWYPIIIFVLFFLGMEVQLLMKLGELKHNVIDSDAKDNISTLKNYFANDFLSPDMNLLILFITVILAVVTGFIMYSYVHSKQKLDLMHSLPVKRGSVFAAKYICGFEYFAVPFLLQMLITFFMASFMHCFSKHAVNNFVLFAITIFVIFLVVYSVTILSIMLTGNIVISMIATVILEIYSTILYGLKSTLISRFFENAISENYNNDLAFSPLDMILDIINKFTDYRNYNSGITYKTVISQILIILLATAVYSILSYLLYRFRNSEAAGKAIAFPVSEGFIKFMVVVPLALYAGEMFIQISSDDNMAWYYFGIAFTYIFTCLVMEIIFRFDFKQCLKHWYHIVFNGICIALIVVIFQADVFNYNSYVPSQSEIAYISASIEGFSDVSTYEEDGHYQAINDFRFENVKLYDDETYNLAVTLAKNTKNVSGYQKIKTIYFCYHLNNGKKVYRKYYYYLEDEGITSQVASIFNSKEYKIGAVPFIKNGWNKEILNLDIESNYADLNIELTDNDKNTLLDAYQSDLMNLTFDTVVNEKPIGGFNVDYKGRETNNYSYTYYEGTYPIYPSFEKTIAFFEGKGAEFSEEEFLKTVSKVTLTYYGDYSSEDFPELEITDKEQIKEIIDNAVSYDLSYNDFEGIGNKYDIDIDVSYIDENGDKNYKYMTFWKDGYPDFVLEKFGLE